MPACGTCFTAALCATAARTSCISSDIRRGRSDECRCRGSCRAKEGTAEGGCATRSFSAKTKNALSIEPRAFHCLPQIARAFRLSRFLLVGRSAAAHDLLLRRLAFRAIGVCHLRILPSQPFYRKGREGRKAISLWW